MEYTAVYSTSTISNMHYSFNSSNLKSAIAFCEWKFNVNINDITILDSNDKIVKFAIGAKVAKESKNRNEYWRGIVKSVNESKSLIHFPTRGLSRWCNTSNLNEVT